MMIIGERSLSIGGQEVIQEVGVRVHAPEPHGPSWVCRYEIDWPGEPRISYGAGYDSIQALHLTLQNIGAELYASRYHASGQLAWGKPGEGYGFPVPSNARDRLIGDGK